MNKKRLTLYISIVIFFIIYLILTFKFSDGYISNLQVYSFIDLIPTTFWIFIILICVVLLIADIGFIKIGAFLCIFTGITILVLQVINDKSSYEVIKSSNYEIILETVDSSKNERFIIYRKESPFFSLLIGDTLVPNYYNVSYEIVGDFFVITKCTENTCITEQIDLK